MKLIKFLGIFGLALGCSSYQPQINQTVRNNPEAINAKIASAQDRWFKMTGLTSQIDHIVLVDSWFSCHGKYNDGCYDHETKTITINIDAVQLDQVILHEVGHSLGIKLHTEGALGGGLNCISQKDIDLICFMKECQTKKVECEA